MQNSNLVFLPFESAYNVAVAGDPPMALRRRVLVGLASPVAR